MSDKKDGRWRDQDGYLAGVELRFKQYTTFSQAWDHDHCEFCWAKFLPVDRVREWPKLAPNDEHILVSEGFTTTDSYAMGADYVWICSSCFEDFDDLIDWVVVS